MEFDYSMNEDNRTQHFDIDDTLLTVLLTEFLNEVETERNCDKQKS